MNAAFCTFVITLFRIVLFEFGASAGLPNVAPLPAKIPLTVVVPDPPTITQFLTVSLFAPLLALALAIQTTTPVAFVLVRVRLRSVPPLVDPSIVTRSAPFRMIIALAVEGPDTARAAPLGRMISV